MMEQIWIRLGLIFILSLLFGMVRQKLHKPIGFGTFIFVAIGSGGLALVAISIHNDNPLPLLGSIVTGIGFLGAGALIRNSDKITGFTSAASIWVFAIFGLLIGIGEYFLGLFIYGTTWIVVGIDIYLERKSIGAYQKKLTIITTKLIPASELTKVFSNYKHKLLHVEVNKIANSMVITFYVEGSKSDINHLPNLLLNQPWFGSCKVE